MRHAVVASRSVWLYIIATLVVFDTVALFFAGIVHLVGADVTLGPVHFVEPTIIPAGVVETAAGVIFLWAAFEVLRGGARRWVATLVAHLFAIAGFLLGLYSTRGGTTPFNYGYHRVMLVIFVVGLLLLFVPSVRVALGRDDAAH